MTKAFTIDTNFFISAFGTTPNQYEILNKIFRKHKIKIMVTNYVNKEMRWYMRRVIESLLIVRDVREADLKKYCVEAVKKVDMNLPQLPDMSVAYLAAEEGIPIVSSDWRLVEVAQQLGLTAMMNSAFLVMLLEEIDDEDDRKFLQDIYERLFSEEITYSVKSQGRYDPVVRIQKIMDSALDVVRLQGNDGSKGKVETQSTHDFPEYRELAEVTREIRSEISDYINLMEEGNYRRLDFELHEATIKLSDLSTEVRMQSVKENDPVYREALTTWAHILLLSSTVALGEQNLQEAEAIVDQLLLIMLENDEVERRLDIEVHLQRITIFFLTEQLSRLKIYFTPAFIQLCNLRERDDIIDLHRIMSIIIAVLTNKETEQSATARDFSEIQYVIQLGVQFISVGNIESAWLLLEQAIHMSLNSDITGLLYAVFEVLLPLSFKPEVNYKPTFEELLNLVKEKVENLPFEDYERRMVRNKSVSDELLIKGYKSPEKIPKQFQGFLDVISVEQVDFKKIGRTMFIRVIDWKTMHVIGIIDPTLSVDENLSVGSSIKLHSGSFRTMKPPKSIREGREVDLLIIAKPEDLRFIIRRAGQVSLAQSKVGEYDL